MTMKMKLCLEEKGRQQWAASVPEIPNLGVFGSTRLEALTGVTVRALHLLADRIETGEVDVENIHIESTGEEKLVELVAAILQKLQEDTHSPNAETIAAFKELEMGGGKRFDTIEELFAELNADD
jgi:hypothetical protein